MKILMIVMVMVTTTFIMAQDEVFVENEKTVNQISYGVKGGVSFNHFLGDIPIELDPMLYTGFTAGIFGNYKISDKFSIQPEILFTRKGSNFDEFTYEFEQLQIANLSLDLYIKTDWIEIPVLGMYKLNEIFSLFGGPYIGFYLNGTVVAEPSVAIFGVELEYDIDADNLRLPDYGIILGGAYNISNNITIQGRWEYGIQNLADDVIVSFIDDDFIVINNSSFQLQLDITI